MKAFASLLAPALLLAAAPAAAQLSRIEVERELREVLAKPEFAFCHDPAFPLDAAERAFCEPVGEKSSVCPDYPSACRAPPAPARSDRSRPVERAGDDGADAGVDAGEERRKNEPPPGRRDDGPDGSGLEVGAGAGAFARILFFGLLAAFVVFVAYTLLKNVELGRSGPDEEKPDDDDAPDPASPAPRVPTQVETDVHRLMQQARAAADRGDHATAIQCSWAALLRRLEGEQLIALHPSRTNGDYVRALRERPELRAEVRTIATEVEHAQFGAGGATATRSGAIHERVSRLLSRALLVATLVFVASGPSACGGGSAEPSPGDAEPLGRRAVADLLARHGRAVTKRTEPIARVSGERVLVLLPDVTLDDAECARLARWVEHEGGALVVAGSRQLLATSPSTCELQRLVDSSFTGITAEPPFGAPRERFAAADLALPPGQGLSEPAIGRVLVERGEAVYAFERQVGDAGHLLVLADDQLLGNVALAAGGNAHFLLSLFESLPAGDVEVCDVWSAAGADTPLDAFSEAHLTPVVLQLFALFALFMVWRGAAFGALREPRAQSRRAFADHARALGRAYARARASRHALGLYAAWVLERLRDRAQMTGHRGLIPLAEALAASTGRPESEIMRVLTEASEARQEAAPPSSFRHGQGASAPRGAEARSDFALMQELATLVAATKTRRTRTPG